MVQTHLSEGDDEAAQGLLLAGKADVVGGDKHLAQNVHLVEGGPEGAVCVPVQLLVFGQAEERPVPLTLGPCIQIPKREGGGIDRGRERREKRERNWSFAGYSAHLVAEV